MKDKTTKNIPIPTSDEMGENEMMGLLVELSGSRFWPAILKFNDIHDGPALSGLASIDPVKEPTQIARTQGWRGGLLFLKEAVLREIEKREEDAKGV